MKFRIDSTVLIYKGNVAEFEEENERRVLVGIIFREINVRYCFVPRFLIALLFDCRFF